MNIELKNGKNLNLDWNPIIFEYLSDYENGIEGIKNDIENSKNSMFIANHIVYSVIRANIDEDLSFREIMSLVNVNDIEKILDFVISQSNDNLNVKKSDNTITNSIKKH